MDGRSLLRSSSEDRMRGNALRARPLRALEPRLIKLDVHDIRFNYGSRTVFSDVTATFEVGVTVLLGANGQGKSTLLSVIAGALKPRAGRVVLSVDECSQSERRRRDLTGFMPQEIETFPGFSIEDAIAYAAWLRRLPHRDRARECEQVIEECALAEWRGRPVSQLSGGTRRRLGLACALVGNPAVLLLDEPTAGLDIEQQHHFRDVLARAAASAVVIISTHVVDEAVRTANHVSLLDGGRLSAPARPEDLLQQYRSSSLEEAYLRARKASQ